MRPGTAIAGTALVLGLVVSLAAGAADRVVERAFVSAGTVRLDLAAGDYDIVASPDNRIRVTLGGKRAGDAVVDISVKGSRATIETDGGFGDGVDARIELPRRTDVVLTFSAGDLKMSGIEGSKDISARAGDVNIAVGERDLYRHVNASVRIGDLNAEPFNVRKEGLFQSFEWTGKGSYDLRAHLTVGDLKLTH